MARHETLTEEEEAELALALSAADETLARSRNAPAANAQGTAEVDAALARRLQENEFRNQQRQRLQQQQQPWPAGIPPASIAHQQPAPAVPSWVVPEQRPQQHSGVESGQTNVVEELKLTVREAGQALRRMGTGIKRWVRKQAQQLQQQQQRQQQGAHQPYPPPHVWQQQQQQQPQASQGSGLLVPSPAYPHAVAGPSTAAAAAAGSGPSATPAGPPAGSSNHSWLQQGGPQHNDEAVARRLQEQCDREQALALAAQEQQQAAAAAAAAAPPGHWQQTQLPPLLVPPLQSQEAAAARPSGPITPPGAGTAASAAGDGVEGGATSYAPLPPLLATPVDSKACAGCGKPLFGLSSLFSGRSSSYMTALGRSWHPECFRCAGCGHAIQGTAGGRFGGAVQFSVGQSDGLPYHAACHKAAFHPRCCVCSDWVPTQGEGRIVWSEVPFWGDRFCPVHASDGTQRCTSCTRLKPLDDEWAGLDDGRLLCLDCIDTVVVGHEESQALFTQVLQFFTRLGLGVTSRPPMMLVESSVLQEVEAKETHGQGRGNGPIFHTRGLCLTEEYTTMRTVLRMPGLNPFAVRQETVAVGPTTAVVKGILVLFGLPRLLTGSILAHELMHAYLRLSGYLRLPAEVEEGLCQLMALLWLEAQQAGGYKNGYEERLAAFFAHQIRTDPSPVYGDGFRAAHDAFQRVNGSMQLVLSIVRETGRLPAH